LEFFHYEVLGDGLEHGKDKMERFEERKKWGLIVLGQHRATTHTFSLAASRALIIDSDAMVALGLTKVAFFFIPDISG
jgi:hypothetical protein